MDVNGQNLDPTATPAITEHVGSLGNNQSVASSYNSGLSTGRGLLGQSDSFNSQLGYGNQAETQAIRNRYAGNYGLKENELRIENVRNASDDNVHNLMAATQAASAEVQLNKQKSLLAWQIDQANRRARGQVLGTVLGITGGVIGGVVGGGAGGAMAGYAAGSGIGNAYGQANPG